MQNDGADRTAYGRFRDGSRDRLALGLLVSVALHLAIFQLVPALDAGSGLGTAGTDLVAMDLPPEVRVPPPPEQVARPAVPVVPTTEVSEDVTIAPTTFDANPVEKLPAPPKASAASSKDRPVFIPRDVEPRLANKGEFLDLLMKSYPKTLKEAGIGGRVILWLFVDAGGEVERSLVKESSGYETLDETAETVSRFMQFEPALNRDKPIGVWVAQSVTFEVKGARAAIAR